MNEMERFQGCESASGVWRRYREIPFFDEASKTHHSHPTQSSNFHSETLPEKYSQVSMPGGISFSKAPLKRFNDIRPDDSPTIGTYDPKFKTDVALAAQAKTSNGNLATPRREPSPAPVGRQPTMSTPLVKSKVLPEKPMRPTSASSRPSTPRSIPTRETPIDRITYQNLKLPSVGSGGEKSKPKSKPVFHYALKKTIEPPHPQLQRKRVASPSPSPSSKPKAPLKAVPIPELRKEFNKAKEEIEKQKTQISGLEEKRRELEKNMAELRKEMAEKEKKIVAFKTISTSLNEELNEAKEKASLNEAKHNVAMLALKENIEGMQQQKEVLEAQVASMKEHLERNERAGKFLEESRIRLTQAADEATAKLEGSQAQIQELQEALQRSEEKCSTLESAIDKQYGVYQEEMKNNATKAEEMLRDWNTERAHLEKMLEDVQRELAKQKSLLQAEQTFRETQEKRVKAAEREISSLKKEYSAKEGIFTSAIKDLEKQLHHALAIGSTDPGLDPSAIQTIREEFERKATENKDFLQHIKNVESQIGLEVELTEGQTQDQDQDPLSKIEADLLDLDTLNLNQVPLDIESCIKSPSTGSFITDEKWFPILSNSSLHSDASNPELQIQSQSPRGSGRLSSSKLTPIVEEEETITEQQQGVGITVVHEADEELLDLDGLA